MPFDVTEHDVVLRAPASAAPLSDLAIIHRRVAKPALFYDR